MTRSEAQTHQAPSVPLGNLADIKTGLAPSRYRANLSDKYKQSERVSARVLGPNYFNSESSAISSAAELVLSLEDYNRFSLEKGDVLLMSRGKSYWAKPAPLTDVPLVFGSPFYRIRILNKDQLQAPFLWWLINQSSTQARLLAIAQGSTVQYVSVKALERLEVPVPPIDLQRLLGDLQECIEEHVDLVKQLMTLKQQLVDQLTQQALNGLISKGAKLSND